MHALGDNIPVFFDTRRESIEHPSAQKVGKIEVLCSLYWFTERHCLFRAARSRTTFLIYYASSINASHFRLVHAHLWFWINIEHPHRWLLSTNTRPVTLDVTAPEFVAKRYLTKVRFKLPLIYARILFKTAIHLKLLHELILFSVSKINIPHQGKKEILK